MSIIAQKNYASKVSFTLMREDHLQEAVNTMIQARDAKLGTSCLQEAVNPMIQARDAKLDQQQLWGSGFTVGRKVVEQDKGRQHPFVCSVTNQPLRRRRRG